jgi:hypothetical protein
MDAALLNDPPFAKSAQADVPTTPTDVPITVFEGGTTPEPHHQESNETPISYFNKWCREMEKDFGPLLGQPCFKIELEKVRQSMKGEAEREAKGKRGREHDNNTFNPLDFDSVGLEQNKTARRMM